MRGGLQGHGASCMQVWCDGVMLQYTPGVVCMAVLAFEAAPRMKEAVTPRVGWAAADPVLPAGMLRHFRVRSLMQGLCEAPTVYKGQRTPEV